MFPLAPQSLHDTPSLFEDFPVHSAGLPPHMLPPSSTPPNPQNDDQATAHQAISQDINILDQIDPGEAFSIAARLVELVEKDKKAYDPFYDHIKHGIEALNVQLDDNGTLKPLDEDGEKPHLKSNAFFQAYMDLLLTITGALFPPSAMVDTKIYGPENEDAQKVAESLKSWFNHYFDEISGDFREEAERAIGWSILAGWSAKKIYVDPITQFPVSRFIAPQDFVIHPDNLSSSRSQRMTHILKLSRREIDIYKDSGYYKNVQLRPDDEESDEKIQDALNKTVGIGTNDVDYNDKTFKIYEVQCDWKVESFAPVKNVPFPLSYIWTIDATSRQPLRVQINWDDRDVRKKAIPYYVIYGFLPALQGPGMGLIQCARNMSQTATDLLRNIVQAGEFATHPAGIYASNLDASNMTNIKLKPTEFCPIPTSMPLDQSFKVIFGNEPSPVLQATKAECEDSIRALSTLPSIKLAEVAGQATMGTILAMLESLLKMPNAIVQRYFRSFNKELELLCTRFRECFEENESYEFLVPGGRVTVRKEDFADSVDGLDANGRPYFVRVVPVAGGGVKNSSYRFMQSEIVLQLANQHPELHNMREVYEDIYRQMGLAEDVVQQFLLPPPSDQPPPPPPPLDPLTENQYLLTGKPVKAYPFQDQPAYITVNSLLLNYPDPQVVASAQALIHERQALQLLIDFQKETGITMPDDPSQLQPDEQNQLAVLASDAVMHGKLKVGDDQQTQPAAPPLDPNIVLQVDAQKEIASSKSETERLKIESEHEVALLRAEIDESKLQQKNEIDHLKLELDQARAERDNFKSLIDMLQKEADELKEDLNPEPQHSEENRNET